MKHLSFLVLLLTVAAPSWASLQECQSLSNDKARLACSESLLKAYEAYFAEKGIPLLRPEQSVTDVEKLISTQAQSEFGMEQVELAKKREELTSLSARVTSVRKNAYGKLTLTLDNQQTWKLSEKGLRVKNGDSVLIERGALGAFYIKKSGSSRKYRAKRVQ